MKPDIAPLVANKGLPQFEQKLVATAAPLEPLTVHVSVEPAILAELLLTTAPEARDAPFDRWQARQ